MSNFERFKSMDSDTFAKEIISLFDTPFKGVIDWKKYMRGDSEIATDYIISKGICTVLPSAAEMIAAIGTDDSKDKEKSEEYINNHSKKMPLLEKASMFGNAIYTVADIENNRILKVPARYIRLESDDE